MRSSSPSNQRTSPYEHPGTSHDARPEPLAGDRRQGAARSSRPGSSSTASSSMRKKGGRFASVNPATGETLAEVSAGTGGGHRPRGAAAREGASSPASGRAWRRAQRMEVLYRFAALVDEHAEPLAVLETLDMGKPIADVVSVDLPAVIETIRFMAECIDKIDGAVTNTEAGVMHMVLREPLRRRRRDLALELSAADGDLEDRARARRRQHGRAEARRTGAAQLPAARGAVRRGRRSRRRVQRRQRPRRGGRARRSRCTTTSPRSPSPARPRSAS